ncbi:FecR domain-containing protein [Alienimonas sp. DA493]|uniref:FecR domain-containing protein n=1 Tax=Alienimonas sp. DA493 TaxID=3373605 RepID=UPI003754C2BB
MTDPFQNTTNDAAADPLDRLLNAAVDDGLSEAEEAELTARLRDDPAARERYRRFMSLHAELHWRTGAPAASFAEPDAPEPAPEPRVRRRALWALGLATLAASLLAAALLPRVWAPGGDGDAASVVSVASVRGAVRYRGPGGALRPVRVAAGLPAGTALLEGASSSVQLRFADGTLVSVGGDAEVEIEERPTAGGVAQKRLRLRSGLLTAEVRPQPAGAPMVIETPAARAEVLGTVFTLAAGADATRLDVEDGLVRLRRSVDGRAVEVPAGRRVIASLDAAADLRSQAPAADEPGWRHVFAAPPPDAWRGRWLPPGPDGDAPARVRSVPLVVGRTDEPGADGEGAPVVHFGVTARRTDAADLGTLPPDAVFTAVLRTDRPTALQVFLGTLKKSGRFGGNFEVRLPEGAGTPLPGAAGAAGWRRVRVPVAAFRPLIPRHATVPDAGRPVLWMLTSFASDDGLEVAELSLTSAGEAK